MSAPGVVLCVSLASCAPVGARAPVFNFQPVFMCLCTGLVRGGGAVSVWLKCDSARLLGPLVSVLGPACDPVRTSPWLRDPGHRGSVRG